MIRIVCAYFLLAMMVACKSDSDKQEQQPQTVSPAADIPREASAHDTTYTDTFAIKMDSLMGADIALPPVYYKDIFSANDEANEKFGILSKATHGKMKVIVNSNMVTDAIVNTIDSINTDYSDLVFLIDKTYSMKDDIENVKAGLNKILAAISRHKKVRLAIALYGDKNEDSSWFAFKDFERNYEAAKAYLDSVQVDGGGDIPESAYDAAIKCYEQKFWRSSKHRSIILVGDAPPLERPLSDYTMNDVIARAKDGSVMMNFYPILVIPAVDEVRIPPTEIARYRETKLDVTLSPNPTSDYIHVSFENSDRYVMELYDCSGKQQCSESFYGLFWHKSVQNLPDGMYILRVINPNKEFESIRFIIHH